MTKLHPVKVGQWAVLELPDGLVVQGRVERVTTKTVKLEGMSLRYSRRYVVSAMGTMTRDDGGVIRQNPTKKGRAMATKKPSAAQLAARKRFAEMVRSGAFKRKAAAARKKTKANPLTRVRRGSPSMATGDAPDERLRKRRRKTATGPKGFYANPTSRGGAHPVKGYQVRRVVHGVAGALVATFPTMPAAVRFARAEATRKRIKLAIVGTR